MANAVATTNGALTLAEYTLDGGQVLNATTVKNYLVRGNGNITDQETLMFIELCKAQRLNPFLNEAYLIKFGTSPANIVVGKDVFVKRANRNEHFEGMRAGGGSAVAYAWYEFEKGYKGDTKIKWIN